MEISQYISILRRWFWLLILGLVLGTLSGYGFAKSQTPVYQADTRVMVSRASMQAASGGSTGSDYYYISDQQLISTYIELLKASAIFENVSQTLGYPVMSEQVEAQQVGDTRILNISVTDTNPQHAADIANAVVAALITQNEELEAGRYTTSEENIQAQIDQVQTQITSLQSQIDKISNQNLQDQIAQAESEISKVQSEITTLQKEIDDLKKIITTDSKLKIAEKQAEMDRLRSILNLYQQAYANLVVLGNSGSNVADISNQRLSQIQTTLSLYQQIYINLLQSLENVRFSRLQNTQSMSQVQAATAPLGPIRPQPLSSAMLSGAVGLMLAAGIIFLIEFLDDTLKVPEDVDRILGIPFWAILEQRVPAAGTGRAGGGLWANLENRTKEARDKDGK